MKKLFSLLTMSLLFSALFMACQKESITPNDEAVGFRSECCVEEYSATEFTLDFNLKLTISNNAEKVYFTLERTGGNFNNIWFPNGIGGAKVLDGGNTNSFTWEVFLSEFQKDENGCYEKYSFNIRVTGGGIGNYDFTRSYTPQELCQEEECYDDETAWANGDRYQNPGNWATYTAYNGEEKTVTLYAGQTLDAGTVAFSEAVDGMVTITITLNSGWRFFDDEENVKIQDYETPPSGNPNPGGFAHKGQGTGASFSIEVPANNFYGVHVDVEKKVECEEEGE